jgi:hypothetical protein
MDKVRQLLFPELPEEEGWSRIDKAMEEAADPRRLDRIDSRARDDMSAALKDAIRELRGREQPPQD